MGTNGVRRRFGVRCYPKIKDPSEFRTILITSIRSLFGELECHSFGLNIIPQQKPNDHDDGGNANNGVDDNNYQFVVECYDKSMSAIRASLTMITTPSYLQSKIYRFDVVQVV